MKAGTTVRWVNVDKRTSHSVLLKDGSEPESDRIFPEEAVDLTFLTPGPQEYLCGPHWETQNMIGMVTVEPLSEAAIQASQKERGRKSRAP